MNYFFVALGVPPRSIIVPHLFFISLLISSLCVRAQIASCGFDDRHKERMKIDQEYSKSVKAFAKKAKEYFERSSSSSRTLATVYNVPVVVHVLYKNESSTEIGNISDDQIRSAITNLNDAFSGAIGSSSDAEITFCLATMDKDGNATTGINRVDLTSFMDYASVGITTGASGNEVDVKSQSIWPPDQYMNIWLVTEISNNGGGSGTQGYAYFPSLGALSRDGIVQLYNSFGYDPGGALGYDLKSYTNTNETLVHETGHYLNLFHTFHDGGNETTCADNTDCLTQGDQVCDTEPHTVTSSTCPIGVNNPCTGAVFGDVIHNYMNYTSQACQDRFTADQITRMRLSMSLGTYLDGSFVSTGRFSHTSSEGCKVPPALLPSGTYCSDETDADKIAFNMGTAMVQIGDIDHNSFTANYDNIIYSTSALVLPEGTTHSAGASVSYSLDLNAFDNGNSVQGKIFIDYNNDGDFDDINPNEEVMVTNASGAGAAVFSGTFTLPDPAPILNTPLKLRVVSDFTFSNSGADITACNVAYGQMEDFFLMIGSALPVNLQSFEAKQFGEDVVLDWVTLQEKDNDYFLLEKSTDGKNYIPLARIAGKGNTSESSSYQYKDPNYVYGTSFYRLSQVDYDGTTEVFKVATVYQNDKRDLFVLYPNPTSENTIYVNSQDLEDELDLCIHDITGNEVLRLSLEEHAYKEVDISVLKPGVYVVIGKDKLHYKKLKLIKL